MALFSAQVHPGQALGFLFLGASLHDVLTRLKAEPQRFPKLDLIYEQSAPATEPVVVNLPTNGLRLRFDGPEQRLRLIEVLDFTKSHLTYKNMDILRPGSIPTAGPHAEAPTGPAFKLIYGRIFGLTFPGEYIKPEAGDETGMGLYVLSYPGIAFSFPLHMDSWLNRKSDDHVALMKDSSPAASMAIFRGESWPDARETLFVQSIDPHETSVAIAKNREPVPNEVTLVRIHGEGQLELLRPDGIAPTWVMLGVTTPQELVALLGPPDAIYRKNDQRMAIHQARRPSKNSSRPDTNDLRSHDDSTDTDQSSAHTTTDDSDDGNDDEEAAGVVSGECFYNYFYHGFDVLLSSPVIPSQTPPSKRSARHDNGDSILLIDSTHRLVASKLILHGNVPGSYPFNRHRRCRWVIQYLKPRKGEGIVDSETPFSNVEIRLHEEWKSIYKNAEEAKSRQRGMVLNRDWGDSPGSSCELLGGWEDSIGGKRVDSAVTEDGRGLGNTTLFGFPGLVFEVLKNGTVSGLTVF